MWLCPAQLASEMHVHLAFNLQTNDSLVLFKNYKTIQLVLCKLNLKKKKIVIPFFTRKWRLFFKISKNKIFRKNLRFFNLNFKNVIFPTEKKIIDLLKMNTYYYTHLNTYRVAEKYWKELGFYITKKSLNNVLQYIEIFFKIQKMYLNKKNQ